MVRGEIPAGFWRVPSEQSRRWLPYNATAATVQTMSADPVRAEVILPPPDALPEHVLFQMFDAANRQMMKVSAMRAAVQVLYDHLRIVEVSAK